MTKYERIAGKVFAENASPVGENPEIGKFGNALQGIYTGEADVREIQNSEAWSQGWTSAVVSSNNYPPLPEMNGVLKVLSYQIAYLLQSGIAEWNSETTYYEYNAVNYKGKFYYSTIDNNTTEPETVEGSANWELIEAPTATSNSKGIMQPDNKSIGISPEGVIGVVMATANRAGIILVDNSTITVNGGTISAKTATATTKGIMQPDNKSTVVNAAGVVSVPTNFNYPQYIPAQIIQLGWMNHEWKGKEELQYTVPDNGYVDLQFQNRLSKAGNSGFIFINDIRIAYFTRDNYSGLSTYLIPVKKGDVIKLSNDYPNTDTFCTIILSYFMPTK